MFEITDYEAQIMDNVGIDVPSGDNPKEIVKFFKDCCLNMAASYKDWKYVGFDDDEFRQAFEMWMSFTNEAAMYADSMLNGEG